MAFLPDVESFANAGVRLDGFVVNGTASLKFTLDVLDHEIQNLPQDYIDCPDFAKHKPCLYLITKNVGFRGRNVEWMDDRCKDGDGASVAPTLPRHPITGGRRQVPQGSPVLHVKPGAICYWKDRVRLELRSVPFADQEDEFTVIVRVKTATRVELVFDLRAISDKPLSFTQYLDGTDSGGHIFHKLPK